MKTPVELVHLEAAVAASNGRARVDKTTGVISVSDDPADNRYVSVPDAAMLGLGKALAMRFAKEELPDQAEAVAEIFSKPDASRGFKQLLDEMGRLDDWFEYEGSATEEALQQWCDDNGFELVY